MCKYGQERNTTSQTRSTFVLFCWWQHRVGSLTFLLYAPLSEGGSLAVSPDPRVPSETNPVRTAWSAGGFEAATWRKLRFWICSRCPQTYLAESQHLITWLGICHRLPPTPTLSPFSLLDFEIDALSPSWAEYSNPKQQLYTVPLRPTELSSFWESPQLTISCFINYFT